MRLLEGLEKQNFIWRFSSVQSLSRVRLLATPWIAARQASLSSPSPEVHSDSCSSSPWFHSAISSSVVPLSSCPQSLPASESFPISQLFAWGGQSTGVPALASFLPKTSQGWSPSEWTGWISLQSRGLSRVFSNTTVQKHLMWKQEVENQKGSRRFPAPDMSVELLPWNQRTRNTLQDLCYYICRYSCFCPTAAANATENRKDE